MPWVAPTVRLTGDLLSASIWNTDVVGNTIQLRTDLDAALTGHIGIVGGSTGGVVFMHSSTYLGCLPPPTEAGQVLKSAGGAAAPVWGNASVIKSIQHGTITVPSGTVSPTVVNATITAIDTAKSVLVVRGSTGMSDGHHIWLGFTSTTQVHATKNVAGFEAVITFSVIEYW